MSKAKAKGTAFESRVVKYLREKGFPQAERRALSGGLDKGDVINVPSVVIECKAATRHELAAWIDETLVEQANAGAQVGFAVFPRRNHHIGKAYVLCTFDQMIALIK